MLMPGRQAALRRKQGSEGLFQLQNPESESGSINRMHKVCCGLALIEWEKGLKVQVKERN